ncbi:MAG: polymer-forming cytoskeletal protein [Syntrophaceae bacterium]|jgi:cytoskeletal protein CcmA (bactofilin family)|nr:polymer-forming cytoskeletal protein [Syntrophaceae bacterium]
MKPKEKKLFGHFFSRQEQPLTILCEGISVVGSIRFGDGVVRLDGHLEGKISGQGTLIIGEKGFLQGEAEVNTLVLNGRVQGQVSTTAITHITLTGRLFGKVHSPRLVIDPGGVFDGEGKTLGSEGILPASVPPVNPTPES